MLDLARSRGLTLIEDDYDNEYRFEGRPVLPLVARAGDYRVVYSGSLSKLLAPGIRLGYAITPPDISRRMADIRKTIDRQGDLPIEHAVASLMHDGELRRHTRKARRIYQARRDLLAEELRWHFGESVVFDLPAGGLALWLRLAEDMDSESWASAATGLGLAVTPGLRFALDTTQAPNAFRLGYASLDETELRRAVGLLAQSMPLESCEPKV